MKVANHFNQDAAAEASAIKRLKEKISIGVIMDRVNLYRTINSLLE